MMRAAPKLIANKFFSINSCDVYYIFNTEMNIAFAVVGMLLYAK